MRYGIDSRLGIQYLRDGKRAFPYFFQCFRAFGGGLRTDRGLVDLRKNGVHKITEMDRP